MVFNTNITLITSADSPITLSGKNDVYIVDATSGNISITLPNILGDGMQYKFKRTDATTNTVTVNGQVGQTIDGLASVQLRPLTLFEVQSYNSLWYLISNTIFHGSLGKPIFTSAFIQNNGNAFVTFSGSVSSPQLICDFYYPGSVATPIINIVAILGNGGGTPTGDVTVRVQGGATIGTIPFTGITGANGQIYQTTTISNLPVGPTVLEYYVTIVTGGGSAKINVYALSIY